MLFLALSEPRAEPPSGGVAACRRVWTWIQPLADVGDVRVGLRVAAHFDLNEAPHAHWSASADLIPATFIRHKLLDPASIPAFLAP
jgi:hypothetical protein